jgi:hypothetical protein
MRRKIYPLLVIVALVLSVLACGSSNSGSISSTAAPGATAAPAKMITYNVGDVVAVQSHTITLNSAEVQAKILKASFTVENKGDKDLSVSSILSFSAKNSDGEKLEAEMFDCGGSGLDGKVLAGDKLKGNICWTVTGAAPYKIYYEASLFGSGAIVWEVK